jgi:hypothetical protein
MRKRGPFVKFCRQNILLCRFAGVSLVWLTAMLLLFSSPAWAAQNQDTQAPDQQISATPQQSARISGRVVDQTGVGVVGASVRLICEDPMQNREVSTGEDGLFIFPGVAAGSFRLAITATGFAAQGYSGKMISGENFTVPEIVLAVAGVNTEVRVVPPSQLQVAEEQLKVEEKQRALGFIPNFYVTYVPDAAPLAAKQKFGLAWKSMIDPVTFGLTGVVAGIQQGQNDFAGYGQGADGYAKRYGAAYADAAIATFIGGAILPSLLKQDPRYFYKGTGSKKSRLLYALAATVICKGDNGHWQANYSGLLGGLAAGGISNLYYPAKDRDAALTFQNFAVGLGASAAANVLQEFVIRKFTSNTPKSDPGNGSTGKSSNPIAKVFNSFVHEGD